VSDDGQGIDAGVLREGKAGHFGLSGMRERAELLGGELSVRSNPGAGTEVALSVAAPQAYLVPALVRRWWHIRVPAIRP